MRSSVSRAPCLYSRGKGDWLDIIGVYRALSIRRKIATGVTRMGLCSASIVSYVEFVAPLGCECRKSDSVGPGSDRGVMAVSRKIPASERSTYRATEWQTDASGDPEHARPATG